VRILSCKFTKQEDDFKLKIPEQMLNSLQKPLNIVQPNNQIQVPNSELNAFTISAPSTYDRCFPSVQNTFGNIKKVSSTCDLKETISKMTENTSCDFPTENHEPNHLNDGFVKYKFATGFLLNADIEVLKAVFTRDDIYDKALVNRKFPLYRSSEVIILSKYNQVTNRKYGRS
jgi:hypothetical protein